MPLNIHDVTGITRDQSEVNEMLYRATRLIATASLSNQEVLEKLKKGLIELGRDSYDYPDDQEAYYHLAAAVGAYIDDKEEKKNGG